VESFSVAARGQYRVSLPVDLNFGDLAHIDVECTGSFVIDSLGY